jgi:hypothetical protein
LPRPEPADPLLIARRIASIALAAAVVACNITTAHAALNFSVSVCLDDFEYAIACRERSSLEAARRLEQIYLDDYATGSPARSLRIWFAVKAEPREQTTFLLEVENRAIEAVFRKLKEDASHRSSGAAGGGADAARQFAQDIERWHDEAGARPAPGSTGRMIGARDRTPTSRGRRCANFPGSATATTKTPSRINLSRTARWNVVKP